MPSVVRSCGQERRQRVDGRGQRGVARGGRREHLVAGRDQALQVGRAVAERRRARSRVLLISDCTLPCCWLSTPTTAPQLGDRRVEVAERVVEVLAAPRERR